MSNEEIINALRNLSKGIFPEYMEYAVGLCYFLSTTSHRPDLRHILENNVKNWEHYSGSKSYPVPHPILDSSVAYGECYDEMWDDSEYGLMRRNLCAWFADYLEEYYL